MRYPARYVRRGRSRKQFRIRIGAVIVTFLLVGLVWFGFSGHRSSSDSGTAGDSPAIGMGQTLSAIPADFSAPESAEERTVYPYSVVPGGVHSSAELQHAAQRDPVVGAHYAGFDYREARVVRLNADRLVHLSYRLRDKIYWTRKTIALHKGEKVITDGRTTARTRCGNQVSEQVKGETSPEEPPVAAFERPVGDGDGTALQTPFPGRFESALLNNRPAPDGAGAGVTAPALTSGLYSPGIGSGYPPIAPPGITSGGGGSGPNPPPPPPPPPPAIVPEPGSIALMASGLAGIYWKYRKARKS